MSNEHSFKNYHYLGSGNQSWGFIATCVFLFVASSVATIYLSNLMSGGMPMPGGWSMSMMWMLMPGQTWPGATLSFLGTWTVMMVAMMLPSLTPMVLQYRRALVTTSKYRLNWFTLLVSIAYLLIWMLFGLGVYALGISLTNYEMSHLPFAQAVPLLEGIIILLAGIIQFTKFKGSQLACCRETIIQRDTVSENSMTAWRHGIWLGLHCCNCCFNLMIIFLVAGMMNLFVMIIITAAIALERMTKCGQRFALINGIGSIVTGVFLIIKELI